MGLDNMLAIANKKGGYTAIQSKELTEILQQLTVGFVTAELGFENSFRGKVYDSYIEQVAGKSLYKSDDFTTQDYADIVSNMEADIDIRVAWEKVNDSIGASYTNNYGHVIPVEELRHLHSLFVYCLVQKQKYGKDFVMGAWY
jgi:hypothetical protein